MTKDNQEKIQEIREALQAATPGPWRVSALCPGYIITDYEPHQDIATVIEFNEDGTEHLRFINCGNNAHLIANAPEWLKWQNEQIESLQLQLDAAKQENERLLHRNESLFNEIEDYQQRLKQVEEALEEIATYKRDVDEPHRYAYDNLKRMAVEALSQINGKGE